VLIPIQDLKTFWKVKPSGVVHVGAHAGEELNDYEKYSFGPVVWIEAQPDLATELSKRISTPSLVIQALVWNVDGAELTLNVTNNRQSSSIFEMGTHAQDYPSIQVESTVTLKTQRLDSILPPKLKFNFLNLDIQGAEYEALEGLGIRLGDFDYVYTEVNRAEVYKGIKQIGQIDSYLRSFGFRRVATAWTTAKWGDAFYLRLPDSGTSLKVGFALSLQIFVYALRLSFRRQWLIQFVSNLVRSLRGFSPSKVR
jgi:FkbM family methyltransferase